MIEYIETSLIAIGVPIILLLGTWIIQLLIDKIYGDD